MDVLNLIKIIAAIITVVFAFIAGYIELRLDPKNWLNRWFALFFISTSLGFLTYTIYHFILFNPHIVIPIMISAHILLNFAAISLVMTVFILEKYEKIAMSFRYFGMMMILFIIMSFGYFIWTPTLNMERFNQGIVDTDTPLGWFIFVKSILFVLFIFVLYKYAKIAKNLEGESKKRISWFFVGVFIVFIGLIFNLLGGISHSILIEILGLICFDIGAIIVVKGFLIK